MSTRLVLDRALRIAAVTTAVLATGCGGGGDGGPPPPPPPQLIQITAVNQDAVARATVATFFSMTGIRALPVAPSPAPQAAVAGVNDLALRALAKVTAPDRGAVPKLGRLTVYTDTFACTLGGSMRLDFDDRDENRLVSAGDVLTITFSQCTEDVDTMISGGLSLAIASAAETATTLQMSGTFTYQQLTIVDAGYTSAINGAMSSAYTESIDPAGTLTVRLESTVIGSGLMAAGSTPVVTDTFTYDAGFRSLSTEVTPATPTPPAFSTIVLNGTVHVSSLGGRITLVMDPMLPVRDTVGQPYPDSGQVTVLGNASRLRLTVMDTVRVRVELDANNDGAFEATRELLWVDLMP